MYFCIPVGRQVRSWTIFEIYTVRLFYWLASSMHLASTFSGLAWTFNIPIHERKVTYRSIARVESSMCWYINPCFQDGTHDLYDVMLWCKYKSSIIVLCNITWALIRACWWYKGKWKGSIQTIIKPASLSVHRLHSGSTTVDHISMMLLVLSPFPPPHICICIYVFQFSIVCFMFLHEQSTNHISLKN